MMAQMKGKLLFDAILPPMKSESALPGSSDVGDVSWVVPTSQILTACGVLGTPNHSWQQVAQGGMGIGYKGFLLAGKVLAAAAVEFMQHPEKVQQARAEFETRTQDKPYISPIPEGVKPPAVR
jgi:aminobenzoyl-glutamate utilization protein B